MSGAARGLCDANCHLHGQGDSFHVATCAAEIARDAERERAILLNEHTEFGGETGAGVLRNRCAFTSRDMGADWPEAFTYAVVFGWDGDEGESSAMDEMAARWGWDEAMVEFLRDAHRRFAALRDRAAALRASNGEGTGT